MLSRWERRSNLRSEDATADATPTPRTRTRGAPLAQLGVRCAPAHPTPQLGRSWGEAQLGRTSRKGMGGGAYGADSQRGGVYTTKGVDGGRWSAGLGRSEDWTSSVDRSSRYKCHHCSQQFLRINTASHQGTGACSFLRFFAITRTGTAQEAQLRTGLTVLWRMCATSGGWLLLGVVHRACRLPSGGQLGRWHGCRGACAARPMVSRRGRRPPALLLPSFRSPPAACCLLLFGVVIASARAQPLRSGTFTCLCSRLLLPHRCVKDGLQY